MRRACGMCRFAKKLDFVSVHSDGIHRFSIGERGMCHHNCVIILKYSHRAHRYLRTGGFLCRRSDHINLRAVLVCEFPAGNPAADRNHRDQVVPAAVAGANLMVASIGERSGELALLKALGATDAAVSRLMLAETAAISLLGAIVGALLGSGVAQLIGRVVFGSGITMRPMVFVLVFVLLAVTVLLASASSIRSILNLKPAEVLHGR